MNEDASGADPGPHATSDATGDIVDRVKDAAYAAVGLGVLGVQHLQVKRRDVTKQLEPQVRETAERLQRLASAADQAVNPVLERIEGKLPDATRDLVRSARSVATDARDTILDKASRPR